ncbi:MAG: sugar kinase [Armatimonadota bacterium]
MEASESLDLISAGECMVELFGEEAIAAGSRLQCTVGGDTLNVLVAAARLGIRAGYITRVGDDIFRPLLLDRWAAEGLDLSQVLVVEGFNGLYVITVSPDGERFFTYYRTGDAAATMEPADLSADYVARARLAHTSGISQAISASSRAAVRRLAELCGELGVKLSYDPNFRPKLWSVSQARCELEWILPRVSIALPSMNTDEALLWSTKAPEKVIERCLEAGCEVVAVKLGSDGCLVASAVEQWRVQAVRRFPVRDTTGAGDAFDGALLSALLCGASLRDAARLGNLVAAMKCSGRGALGNLPSADEVTRAWPEAYDEPLPKGLIGQS